MAGSQPTARTSPPSRLSYLVQVPPQGVRRLLGRVRNFLNLITGWDATPDELKKAGERINNLKKLFNIREGWTRADDTLPPRALAEPLPDGVAAGIGLSKPDLDLMIDAYYQDRGWNPDGSIPESKLSSLGLDALNPVAAK